MMHWVKFGTWSEVNSSFLATMKLSLTFLWWKKGPQKSESTTHKKRDSYPPFWMVVRRRGLIRSHFRLFFQTSLSNGSILTPSLTGNVGLSSLCHSAGSNKSNKSLSSKSDQENNKTLDPMLTSHGAPNGHHNDKGEFTLSINCLINELPCWRPLSKRAF